jgi:3-methyladenine DNA glycosylase/8-oxoguanine DNA glycosylase
MRLTLAAPSGFSLAAVALSHGWSDLEPFAWQPPALAVVVQLGDTVHDVRITQSGDRLTLHMTPGDRGLATIVASMLRLDEDLQPLYAITDGEARLAYARPRGAGRLLRAPSVFEDVIKMLLTTNCSWSLTRLMVQRLVAELGAPSPSGKRAFPTAQAMAKKDERFYRDVVKAGYRAPHLVKIARDVATGALALEAWRDPRLDDALLRKQLLALPGIGPYAADNLLRLCGHYAYLGLDSWCRGRIKKLYPRARDIDAFAERRYRRYGRFAGLAMWLDLTAEWHREATQA